LAIDPDITGQELDKPTRGDLRSLSEVEAERVAKHLVMVARYIDDDPELAYQHAVSARSGPASRLATVREAAGLAAYRAGQYSEALADLRAAHRISGSPDLLPLIADSERGLGRPERALAIFDSPEARTLDTAGKVEILLVAAGARRDMGQPEAALAMLRVPLLETKKKGAHIARLRAGYADVLRELGRGEEAEGWLALAVEADPDDETGVSAMLEDAITYDDAEFLDLEEDDLGLEEEVDEDGDLLPELGMHDEVPYEFGQSEEGQGHTDEPESGPAETQSYGSRAGVDYYDDDDEEDEEEGATADDEWVMPAASDATETEPVAHDEGEPEAKNSDWQI
jgi:tetratricopeptide (TPR) repeat protein